MLRQSDKTEAAPPIQPMTQADVTFLTDLWAASWQEAMPAIDFAARRAWIAAFLGDPAHATLVASVGVRPVGFVSLEGHYLHQLAVAATAKGDGTAVRLLDAAKARAAHELTLDVNQANARAMRFYEREGFVIEQAGTNPGSGLPTWRMRWRAP